MGFLSGKTHPSLSQDCRLKKSNKINKHIVEIIPSNQLFNIVRSQVIQHYTGHSEVTFIIILGEDIGTMGFFAITNYIQYILNDIYNI